MLQEAVSELAAQASKMLTEKNKEDKNLKFESVTSAPALEPVVTALNKRLSVIQTLRKHCGNLQQQRNAAKAELAAAKEAAGKAEESTALSLIHI